MDHSYIRLIYQILYLIIKNFIIFCKINIIHTDFLKKEIVKFIFIYRFFKTRKKSSNLFLYVMLLTGILIIILSNAVTLRRDKSIFFSKSGMIIALTCFIISINNFYINFIDQGIGLFGGTFVSSAITHAFHIFIFLITFLILQLSSFYPRKIWTEHYSSLFDYLIKNIKYFNSFVLNKMSQQYRILEYPLIIVFALIGGVFLISAGNLISIFISIELQSYALYIICALYRNSERPLSGALIYFLLGGLSSCFILLAIALLYINTGHTNFDNYYIMGNISDLFETKPDFESKPSYVDSYKNFSLAVLSVGFLFKISAAPFHFWSPDVYDAVPTTVTTFIAIFAKISIFVLLLELVHFTSDNFSILENDSSKTASYNVSWTLTLLVSSLLSLIIGSILGLTQFRIKRLYAYSTISQLGFILLALTINSVESIQSFIFYIMQYSLSNLNAFLILIAVGYTLYLYIDNVKKNISNINEIDVSDKNNSPIQLISEMKGYFHINPILSISLAVTLFSFVGVPPLIGFFAKQMVLISAIDKGYMFMVFVAILTSVISACYYLALIKEIFFYETDYIIMPNLDNWSITLYLQDKKVRNKLGLDNIYLGTFLTTTISGLTLVVLLFILIPQEWLNMTTIMSLMIFNC